MLHISQTNGHKERLQEKHFEETHFSGSWTRIIYKPIEIQNRFFLRIQLFLLVH